MFWENFGELLKTQTKVVRSNEFYEPLAQMAVQGTATEFVTRFEKMLKAVLTFRDLMQIDEKHIKMVLLSILHIDGTFLVDSERELGNGYADILLQDNPSNPGSATYEWIIELKYLKKKTLKDYNRVATEAKFQADTYRAAYIDKYNNGRIVKTLVLIVSGKGKIEVAC